MLNTKVSNPGVRYSEPDIYTGKLVWAEYQKEFYPRCVSHLGYKTYRPILNKLNEAMDFDRKKRAEITQKIQEYRRYVRDKLESFGYLHTLPFASPLAMSEIENVRNEPHFIIVPIIQNVFRNTMHYHNRQQFPYQQWDIIETPTYLATLRSGGSSVAVGDPELIHYFLDKIIRPLEVDEKILSIISELAGLEKDWLNNEALNEFEGKRTGLIQQLTYGQKDLKGDCDLCP